MSKEPNKDDKQIPSGSGTISATVGTVVDGKRIPSGSGTVVVIGK